MPDTIRIYLKRPEDMTFIPGEISNTLEALQELVGGYIEPIRLRADLAAIVNEEGVLRDMPFNMYLAGHWLRGTIVLIGVDGEEFTHAPFANAAQANRYIRKRNHR